MNAESDYTFRDILDFAYVNLLVLQILRSEPESLEVSKNYARKTTNCFNYFKDSRSHLTDLYQFLHIIVNAEDYAGNFKYSHDNATLIARYGIIPEDLSRHLKAMVANRRDHNEENRLLLNLETKFLILEGDFRSCRRIIRDWDRAGYTTKQLVITKLLHMIRGRMPKSDLRRPLEEYANKFRMK